MGLTDLKFKETDFTNKKIADLSDTPSSDGMTAEQLKAYFDYIPKAMIALGAINNIIDALCSTSGAEDIGASVTGVTGINVQAVLTSLKGLIDDRYTKAAADALLDGKASTSTVSGMIASVDFDPETGIFTFTEQGGTAHTFDTSLEKVVTNWDYDEDTQKLVLTLESGETKNIDLSAFVTVNEFLSSDTITFSVSGAKVTASVKNGSITDAMLQSSLLSAVQAYAESCEQNAQTAESSKTNAGEYADEAAGSASAAASSATSAGNAATTANQKATAANNSAILAQSYAEGGTGTREGEDADNAKYYMEQAKAASGGDYITKVSPATEGNIPTLTADGQLVDSGKKAEDMGGAFIITYDRTTNTADKTYAEIKSAHEAGKQVQLIYHNIVFDYIGITDDASLWFAGSAPLKNSPVIITNQYVLMSVNSSNVWQAYIQSLVPVADTEGNILMAKNILGGKIWESVTPPFLNTVSSTTENHIPAFDENGQLVDSGKAASDFVPTPTTITGTLTAGSTSLVLSNAAITTDSTIDIYTDKWGVNPTDVTVVTGKLTLTFDAQDSALGVKVEVR